MQYLSEVRSVIECPFTFQFFLVVRILRALATVLVVERQDRAEEITLTSSVYFLERFIFLLPISFRRRSFL